MCIYSFAGVHGCGSMTMASQYRIYLPIMRKVMHSKTKNREWEVICLLILSAFAH